MKKVFLSIALIILLLIGGLIIYDNLPMYMKDDAIFKGYTDRVGRDYSGKDLDIYYVYYYREEDIEKFADSGLYKEVYYAADMAELKEPIRQFEQYGDVKIFSDSVSVGDYYILKYFNRDGEQVDKNLDNYQLYFFDTDTQRLYYLRQTI